MKAVNQSIGKPGTAAGHQDEHLETDGCLKEEVTGRRDFYLPHLPSGSQGKEGIQCVGRQV
jgi:hypothetical protein